MEEVVAFPLDIANDAALPDIWNAHHSKVAADGDKPASLHGQQSWYDCIHVGLRFCRGKKNILILRAVVLCKLSLVFFWNQIAAMQ